MLKVWKSWHFFRIYHEAPFIPFFLAFNSACPKRKSSLINGIMNYFYWQFDWVNCFLMQVSRNLFRWTKEMSYADYYERAIVNGVLSIQRGTDPGIMIYMLPLGVGVSKAKSYHGWGTQFSSFWCCYGTGEFISHNI